MSVKLDMHSDECIDNYTEWTTRDGTKILVQDMTNAHLENSIKRLKLAREEELVENGCYDSRTVEWIDVLKSELINRGMKPYELHKRINI